MSQRDSLWPVSVALDPGSTLQWCCMLIRMHGLSCASNATGTQ